MAYNGIECGRLTASSIYDKINWQVSAIMDDIDRKLLQILSQNSSATATEMMSQVNLSIPAINKRIQKLRQSGVIRQFTILVDPEKVGRPIQAFILVVLQQNPHMDCFMKNIHADPDILECYAVTGEYDYLLKVCASDMEMLEEKLTHLKRQSGVIKSHTLLSLMEHKHQISILPDAQKK